MERITFANGISHSCTVCATTPYDKRAYVALDDVDFVEAARIFSDTEMTSEMEYAGTLRLVGYTTLIGVSPQPYGIQAVLEGGHDERIS